MPNQPHDPHSPAAAEHSDAAGPRAELIELTDALGLVAGDCVAIVGGGGKTTIMYRLAREAVSRGRTAVAGGTTRFTPPRLGPMPPVVLVEPGDDPPLAVTGALVSQPSITVSAGRGDKGRFLPVLPEQADAIAAAGVTGLLVLEADGSRSRGFKAPGEGEPVIPARTTVVLSVVGLDVVGRPLTDENVHRPERVALLAGVSLGSPITPEIVSAVLLHPDGGRKAVPPGARWIPVLNKAEPPHRGAGETTAALLLAGGAPHVVLASADSDRPVVAVFGR